MNNFNIESNKVIGVVKKNGDHADIFIVGFQDNDYHFIGFSSNESKSLFKDKGKVFAPNFAAKNEKLIDELVIIRIKSTNNYEEGRGYDMYIIDYDTKTYKYDNTKIYNINSNLPESNTCSITSIANGLDINNKYYKDKNRIYYFDAPTNVKGIAKFWNFNDDFKNKHINLVCGYENEYFIVGDHINDHDGYVDFFDDEKIVAYIINLIKNSKSSLSSIGELPIDLVKNLNIPHEILQHRFDKFKDILSKYDLSYNNIIALSKNPLLSEAIIKSIQEYEDDYIKAFEAKHATDIDKLKKDYDEKANDLKNKNSKLLLDLQADQDKIRKLHKLEIESLKNDIFENEQEAIRLKNEIDKKQEELTQFDLKLQLLEENKCRLIKDYSIIKEVIGSSFSQNNINARQYQTIEDIQGQGDLIQELKEFKEYIRCNLEVNLNNLIGLFIKNRVLLLPNTIVVKSLIDAIGDYNLLSVCVGVNWKSYNDLYENGLREMLFSCKKYSQKIHLLILQNMNLSYIPCYMQPINDVITGLIHNLPGDHGLKGIPSNLWIIGTRTREEAMIIPKEYIRNYGCLEYKTEDYNLSDYPKSSLKAKHISMECIYRWRKELEMVDSESNYESYID